MRDDVHLLAPGVGYYRLHKPSQPHKELFRVVVIIGAAVVGIAVGCGVKFGGGVVIEDEVLRKFAEARLPVLKSFVRSICTIIRSSTISDILIVMDEDDRGFLDDLAGIAASSERSTW